MGTPDGQEHRLCFVARWFALGIPWPHEFEPGIQFFIGAHLSVIQGRLLKEIQFSNDPKHGSHLLNGFCIRIFVFSPFSFKGDIRHYRRVVLFCPGGLSKWLVKTVWYHFGVGEFTPQFSLF